MSTALKKRLRKAAFKKPEITVKLVLPSAVSTSGSTVKMWIQVFNPNPYALHVVRLAYKVCKVSDQAKIAEGALTEAFNIPSKESVDAKMDVTITFSGIGSAGRSFAVRGGRMRYLISGTLTVKKFLTPIAIPFEKEKEFSLFERSESKDAGSRERVGSKETRTGSQDTLNGSKDSLKNYRDDPKNSRLKQSCCKSTERSSSVAAEKTRDEIQRWRPRSFQGELTTQSSSESKETAAADQQRRRPRKVQQNIIYF